MIMLKSKNSNAISNIEKTNGQVEEVPKSAFQKKPLGSIDLDDIDRPMRVVEECMQRLELQHQLKEKARQAGKDGSSDSESESETISEDTSESNKSEEYVLEDATHDNPLMGSTSVCVCFTWRHQKYSHLFRHSHRDQIR